MGELQDDVKFTERQGCFHGVFTIGSEIVSRSRRVHSQERRMTTRPNIRITLTPEQKEEVRKATGKEADAVELSVEELEERIAPYKKRIF